VFVQCVMTWRHDRYAAAIFEICVGCPVLAMDHIHYVFVLEDHLYMASSGEVLRSATALMQINASTFQHASTAIVRRPATSC
jgi:hypothetical protein